MKNIKSMKYLIGFLLLMIGFLFNGELFLLYADNFQNSYYRTSLAFFQSSRDPENEEIAADFLEAGEKTDVDFYFVDGRIVSEYEKDVNIYGTPGALEALREHGIREGTYHSLFLGEVSVTYGGIADAEDMTQFENCYLIGDESKLSDMREFKALLIGQYGGGFPHLYGSDRELYLNLLTVWVILFGILLLISVYEVTYLRKENALRFIMGENISGIFLRSAAADTCVYLLILLLLPVILRNVSYVSFQAEFTAGMAAAFLAANILILSGILRVNIRKSLSGAAENRTVGAANYLLKMVTGVLTIVVLSGNLMILAQGYNMYRQEEFFQENRDFSSYELAYSQETDLSGYPFDAEDMQRSFYAEFFSDSLQFADLSAQMGYDHPMVLLNRPAFLQLAEKYPQMRTLERQLSEDGCYILFPPGMDENSAEVRDAGHLGDLCFPKFVKTAGKPSDNPAWVTPEVSCIPYEADLEVTAIDDKISYQSVMLDNPVVLLDMSVPDPEGPMRSDYWNYGTIYRIEEDRYTDFLERFRLTDEIERASNVLDLYEYNRAIIQRSLRIAAVLSVFLLVLEFSLISFILKLQYRLNAVEMALKKILGYTLIARNRLLIALTAGSCVISLTAAFAVSLFVDFSPGGYVLAAGISVTALEMILLLRKAISLEKERIPQILKGESI